MKINPAPHGIRWSTREIEDGKNLSVSLSPAETYLSLLTDRTLKYEAALKPLAEIPLGGEIIEHVDHILYINMGKAITVGDVLAARAALQPSS